MNDDANVQEVVFQAIERACNIEAGSMTTENSIQDLGLDSMSITSVLAELEATYEIAFSSEQVIEFLEVQQIGDVVSLVRKAVGLTAEAS